MDALKLRVDEGDRLVVHNDGGHLVVEVYRLVDGEWSLFGEVEKGNPHDRYPVVITPRDTPEEGVTRCGCGAKYWDGDRCASCGERYRPGS